MLHDYTVSTQFAREVVSAYRRMGFEGTFPVARDIMNTGSERISLHSFTELLCCMEQQSGQSDIGLLVGQNMEPACFTVLGHLVMASDTVGEALSYVARLQPLVIDCANSECHSGDYQVDFFWNPVTDLGVAEKLLVDLVLSATRHFGIWATGIAEPFQSVKLQVPRPEDTRLYREIFGVEGEFSQSSNGFSIPASWYDRPIRSANHDLKPLIFDKAEALLKSINGSAGIHEKLQSVIRHLLPEGTASIETAAAALHMSPRTLQRHLHEADTRFSEVLQQVRFERANHLLKHTQMSLTEIAMQVGYREQSSFSNAYKNWTGLPPRQIRLKALG